MYKTYMKKPRNTLKDLEVYLNRGKYIFVLVRKKKKSQRCSLAKLVYKFIIMTIKFQYSPLLPGSEQGF